METIRVKATRVFNPYLVGAESCLLGSLLHRQSWLGSSTGAARGGDALECLRCGGWAVHDGLRAKFERVCVSEGLTMRQECE